MSQMDWNVNRISREPINLNLKTGDILYIVGTNGSGKSALIHNFALEHWINKRVRWIAAHRQTWLNSGATDFTSRNRQKYEENRISNLSREDSRWKDNQAAQHLSAVLYDLGAKENARARSIVRHLENELIDDAQRILGETPSPLDLMNQLLRRGSLNVELENADDGSIVAKREGGATYDIAQMSDGERSAMIIAAQVITAEPGTVFLIDEPERHLHRSIIEPFLTTLFDLRREDCTFVISTHDVMLPVANPDASVLMLRSCEWNGAKCVAWDAEILKSGSELPEEFKVAILGGRKKILFVEGKAKSLDLRLYRVLFPNISVEPKGCDKETVQAVRALRETKAMHHVEPFGLIDRDNRGNEKVAKLAEINVFALDVYSVEGFYYCSAAIEAVARKQAAILNIDADELVTGAKKTALGILNDSGIANKMAAHRCPNHVQEAESGSLSDTRCIKEYRTYKTAISNELNRYLQAVHNEDFDELVARYPLHKTGVFNEITKALTCHSKQVYERMVVARIQDDKLFRDDLKNRLRPLVEALGPEEDTGLKHSTVKEHQELGGPMVEL